MNPLQKEIENVVKKNSTLFLSDQEHVCPYCNRVVPKQTHEIFGKIRTVQPVCKCEAEAHLNQIKRIIETEEKESIERLFSISHLGKKLEKASFDNFDFRPGAETALNECKKYVDNFGNMEVSLIIWGTYGNGKSHLAASVANELKAKGKTVVFQSVPELLERIRKTFNKNKEQETEHQIMQALLNCDLLVLDDIGAEKPTDWVSDVLFRIIDGRYRKEAHTFYTSNLKPVELEEKLGGRIYDRILETTLPIQNKAGSYREQKARERFEQYRKNAKGSDDE